MSDTSPFVVSADWLQERLGTPGLSIIDGSWYLPAHNRDPKAEYEAGHIPGAVFFDHDTVVEPDTGLPHSLPHPGLFQRFASSMGISEDDTIVVYDGPGFFSAPRVWWIFRVMGADKVYVLDGGLDGWKREGRPVTDKQTNVAPCVFEPKFDRDRVASFDEMMKIVGERSAQIADARSRGRFEGTDPEPRPGMRSGHMPGAANVPVIELSKDGKLLSVNELRAKLEASGLDLEKPVVTSCGSGITAAVITLALESVGHRNNRLYDGSWSEWGGRSDTPIVTGKD